MVVHESYVTRKPVTFMLIVVGILLIIFIPLKFIMEYEQEKRAVMNVTYEDAWKGFFESGLTEEQRQDLFNTGYKGNNVEWQGKLLECKQLNDIYAVKVQQKAIEDKADVVFSTGYNCTARKPGYMMRYRMELLDLQVNVFVGKNGDILA